MNAGFLISTFQSENGHDCCPSAPASGAVWRPENPNRLIDIWDGNCRITCLDQGNPRAGGFWTESESEEFKGSFISVLGWCYRISSAGEGIAGDEVREMMVRLRQGLPPIGEDFGGNFVVVAYDALRRRIAIQPDRWAMGGVYFAQSEKGIAVSNRAIPVASLAGAAFDGCSVLSLMRGTHMPFGRSLFSGVQRLMCGQYLDIQLDRGIAELKRPFPLFVEPQNVTLDESVEQISDALRAIARRSLAAGSAQFDLTGGDDTRMTAASISSVAPSGLGAGFGWRVVGEENHADARIAREIAQLCGWNLLRLDRRASPDASTEDLSEAAVLADGTCTANASWARLASEIESMRVRTWDSQIGSVGGELLRGFFWRQEMLSLGRSSRVNHDALLAYRLYASPDVDFTMFGARALSLQEHDEALLAPYRRIDQIGDASLNPYKLDVMYLHKLCYSAGNTFSWLAGFQNIRLPLLSWEITRIALSIPWRLRTNRGLVQRVIARLDPRLCTLANSRGESMRPLSPATFPSYVKAAFGLSAERFSRIARRQFGRFAGAKNGRHDSPPSSSLAILDQTGPLESLFDPRFIQSTKREASATASPDSLRALHVLSTVALLLRAAPKLRRQVVFGSG